MNLKSLASVLLKVVLPVVVGLAALVAVTAALSGFFSEKISPGRTGRPVVQSLPEGAATVQVHEITQPYMAEAVGTLKAAARTAVAAQVSARILEVRVKAGDNVEVGDVLIVLDPSELQAALGQTEAALVEAEASYLQARQEYDRDAELVSQQVIAQAKFDASTRNLKTTQARVEQAKQAIQRAKVRLGYTVIDASLAGTIVDTLAEPGEIASPGVPLLNIYDLSSLRLEVPIMENLVGKIQPGDQLAVEIDAIQDRQFQATVDEIVPQASAASRSFLVKLQLPPIEGVYEFMFGRVKIPVGERKHLCLTQQAVQTIGQLQFVDVVRDDDTLERRFVKLGREGKPGFVEVISGLTAADRVLLRPTDKSSDEEGTDVR